MVSIQPKMKMTSQIPSYHFLKEMKLLIGTSIHLYRGPEPFCFDHMCTWWTVCWLFSHTLFFYHLEETKKVIIYTCIHMCLWMCVWVKVRMRVNLKVYVRVSVYVSTYLLKSKIYNSQNNITNVHCLLLINYTFVGEFQ